MSMAFLGRQAVVDAQGNTHFYSLLFRHNNSKRTVNAKDAIMNFATGISDLLYSLGIHKTLQGKTGFLKVDDQTIIKADLSQIPKDNMVFELTDQTNFSIKASQIIEDLAAKGYKFALPHTLLDEVVSRRDKSFLALFDYVMFNIRKFDLETFRKYESLFGELNMTLVATKVETQHSLEMGKNLGFKYFLGFFFEEPIVVKGKRLTSNMTTLLKLMATLQSDSPIEEVIKIIKYAPDVSLKLLKFINSAHSSSSKEVESIERAVTLLGRDKLKSWTAMLLFTSHEGILNETLTDTALMRARLMELMCDTIKRSNLKGAAYLVGILSLAPVVFKIPLDVMLAEGLFSQEISDALEKGEGELGKILKLVMVLEHGNFKKIEFIADKMRLSLDHITDMLKDAYNYVNQVRATP